MQRDKKFILGAGIDNISFNNAIECIVKFVELHSKDRQPHYVATINTSYIVNSMCWNWPYVYNNELLDQIRSSSLSLCDSTPLQWYSRLLGSPITERVAGSSLLVPLAGALAQKGYSIFLLGGTEAEAQGAAKALKSAFPDLKIAGTASPKVYTEGANLIDENERDDLLVEEINNVRPDVLLINFGSPKQELWFSRVSSDIKVPVSIGVGGSFSFLSGSIQRAPQWMQNWGLEWAYRLYQEPKRLWKRYLLGNLQALYMAVPALIYHQICNVFYHLIYKHTKPLYNQLQTHLYVSSTRTIAVIELPTLLNIHSSFVESDKIEQAFTHDHIVVDFRHVKHITIDGISFLVDLWMRAQNEEKELSGLALSGDMRLLLKMHRSWDILGAHQHKSVKYLITTLQQARYNTLYDTITQDSKTAHISFFGKLDNEQDYERMISRLEPILKERHCNIDLTYCTTIESRGLTFLLQLKHHLNSYNKKLCLSNVSDTVKRELKRAELLPLLNT